MRLFGKSRTLGKTPEFSYIHESFSKSSSTIVKLFGFYKVNFQKMTSNAPDPEPELEANYPLNISPPPYDQHENGKLFNMQCV